MDLSMTDCGRGVILTKADRVNAPRQRLKKTIYSMSLLMSLVLLNGCITNEVISDLEDVHLDDARLREIKINTAIDIATQVRNLNLHEINLTEIETYDDYIGMITNLNFAIEIINEKIDSDFKVLGKDIDSYNKFVMEVTRYSPLINNYNEFIRACYSLDPADEESVDNLYIKGMTFAGEATLIFSGAYYNPAYKATGELANLFGLTKMASVCSACVSTAMSSIHWFIRNYLIEETSGIFEKTLSGNYTSEKIVGSAKQILNSTANLSEKASGLIENTLSNDYTNNTSFESVKRKLNETTVDSLKEKIGKFIS